MKNLFVALIGTLSALYLLNPGFGLFEFIPDSIPFIGNLDEGTAMYLFISALAYFGIDVRGFFKNWWTRQDKK